MPDPNDIDQIELPPLPKIGAAVDDLPDLPPLPTGSRGPDVNSTFVGPAPVARQAISTTSPTQAPPRHAPLMQTGTQGIFNPEPVTATAARLPATPQSEALRKKADFDRKQAEQWDIITQQGRSTRLGPENAPPQFKGEEFLAGAVGGFNPIINPVALLIQSSAEGVKAGTETIIGGVKEANRLADKGRGAQAYATAALSVVAGLVKIGFSAATPFVPVLQAFTVGGELAGKVPSEKFQEGLAIAQAPFQTLIDPKTIGGKSAAELGDLVWFGLAAHYGPKLGRETVDLIKNKFAKNQPLTPGETNLIRQALPTIRKAALMTPEQAEAGIRDLGESMPLSQGPAGEGVDLARLQAQKLQEKADYYRNKLLKSTPESKFHPVENVAQEPADIQQVREELLSGGMAEQKIVNLAPNDLRAEWRKMAGVPEGYTPEPMQSGKILGTTPEDIANLDKGPELPSLPKSNEPPPEPPGPPGPIAPPAPSEPAKESPSVGKGPLMIKTKDGRLRGLDGATSHEAIAEKYGLPESSILDRGYMDKEGKFVSEKDAPKTPAPTLKTEATEYRKLGVPDQKLPDQSIVPEDLRSSVVHDGDIGGGSAKKSFTPFNPDDPAFGATFAAEGNPESIKRRYKEVQDTYRDAAHNRLIKAGLDPKYVKGLTDPQLARVDAAKNPDNGSLAYNREQFKNKIGDVKIPLEPTAKEATGQGPVSVPIKQFGKEGRAPLLETYKDRHIVKVNDHIAVYDPKRESLFFVALDDSKMGGNRHFVEGADNVETARKYIDGIDEMRGENAKNKPVEPAAGKTEETTFDVERSESGAVTIKAMRGDKMVGRAVFSENAKLDPDAPTTHSAGGVFVDESLRRQGIGTAIYKIAKAEGLNVIPSGDFTELGGKFQKGMSEKGLYGGNAPKAEVKVEHLSPVDTKGTYADWADALDQAAGDAWDEAVKLDEEAQGVRKQLGEIKGKGKEKSDQRAELRKKLEALDNKQAEILAARDAAWIGPIEKTIDAWYDEAKKRGIDVPEKENFAEMVGDFLDPGDSANREANWKLSPAETFDAFLTEHDLKPNEQKGDAVEDVRGPSDIPEQPAQGPSTQKVSEAEKLRAKIDTEFVRIERLREEQNRLKVAGKMSLAKQKDFDAIQDKINEIKRGIEDMKRPAAASELLKVTDQPISEVKTDIDAFQNRDTEFSQKSVDKIKNAVKEGKFDWNKFDAVLLWRDPKGDLFVLAGHSRLQAFKELTAEGVQGFDKIPSKIFKGTKEEAKYAALTSNIAATAESSVEKAKLYRKMREDGATKTAIQAEAEKNEEGNQRYILALSHLNPKGRLIEDLKALGSEGTESGRIASTMAQWVGQVRASFPELKDAHENELYDFIKDNYGKEGRQFTSYGAFSEFIDKVMEKRIGLEGFNADEPLNIKNIVPRTVNEIEYDERLDAAKAQVTASEAALAKKVDELKGRGASQADYDRILQPFRDELGHDKRVYAALKEGRADAMRQIKDETLSLFDEIDEKKEALKNAGKSDDDIVAAERGSSNNAKRGGSSKKAGEIGLPSERNQGRRPGGTPPDDAGALQSVAVPALTPFLEQDVIPKAREAAGTLVKFADSIARVFNPTARGPAAQEAASIITIRAAEQARHKELAIKALEGARKMFGKLSNPANLDFINGIETGEAFQDPLFTAAAKVGRAMLHNRWKEIQDIKGIDTYLVNYFPHIWKDPEAAGEAIARFYAKRPFEGTKTYLKERSLPLTSDGIKMGLEPVSYNPVDLVLARVIDMDKFIMAHKVMEDARGRGLMKFFSVFDKPPTGWTKPDDRFATVFGNPNIPVSEYVDRIKYEKLQDVVDAFGLRHERKMNLRGNYLGYAQKPNIIKTKFATPLGVLTHEIGHHLHWQFDLWNKIIEPAPKEEHTFTKGKRKGQTVTQAAYQKADVVAARVALKKELVALADLRIEGLDPESVPKSHKEYLHKEEEKIANMIDAYVNAPDRFKKVAPITYAKFDRFIDTHKELLPLRDVKDSLTRVEKMSTVNAGGIIIRGAYYFPEPATTVLNNYLSPGLMLSPIFGPAYKSARMAGNFLNQVQLGISPFHLAFTSLDTSLSKMSLAANRLALGHPLQAAKLLAQVPIAPIENYFRGSALQRDYYSEHPEVSQMVNAVILGGGRVKMDSFYHNSAVEGFWNALHSGNPIGAVARTPGALIEYFAMPIMQDVVPKQKLGVFADMAHYIFEDFNGGKLTKEQTVARLQEAWRSVDNRMGQLVYDNLFWHRSAKDLGLLMVRSLGWNIGTFRELGGGLIDIASIPVKLATGKEIRLTPRMAYTMSLPVGVGMIGAMIGYLYTGKGPQELKDYFFPKTGRKNADGTDERMSFPSYMRDVYAFSEQPGKTIGHKLHPVMSMVAQMLENEDFYGVQIHNPDDPLVQQLQQEAEFIAKQFIPFSIRNLQMREQTGTTMKEQIQTFGVLTPAPRYLDQTPAEKMMRDIMASRGHGVTKLEDAKTKRAKIDFVNKFNLGTLNDADIEDAKAKGIMSPQGTIDKDVQRRINMSSTERMFQALSMDEALKVYGKMTDEEHGKYLPLLQKKIHNAQKKPVMPAMAQ